MIAKGSNTFEKRQVTLEGNTLKQSYVSQGLKAGEVVVKKGSLYVFGQ